MFEVEKEKEKSIEQKIGGLKIETKSKGFCFLGFLFLEFLYIPPKSSGARGLSIDIRQCLISFDYSQNG